MLKAQSIRFSRKNAAVGALCACALLRTAGYAERAPTPEPAIPVPEQRARNVLDCMAEGQRWFQRENYRRAAMQFEKVLALDPLNQAADDYLKRCEKLLGPGGM